MCIQCLDASAFGKEVYCMYCRFVPRNTWKGACVPLPVSAEWCLAVRTVFAELDLLLESMSRALMGKDCGEM